MRISMSLLLMSAIACRSDKTFVVQNPAPLADIISHDNGSYVLEGAPTLFFGSALDSNHTPDQLLVVWYVNGNVACEETAPAENGDTECEMRLGLDDSEVAAVRCCAETDGSCAASICSGSTPALTAINPSNATFSEASYECRAHGLRLCEASELGMCCGGGCDLKGC